MRGLARAGSKELLKSSQESYEDSSSEDQSSESDVQLITQTDLDKGCTLVVLPMCLGLGLSWEEKEGSGIFMLDFSNVNKSTKARNNGIVGERSHKESAREQGNTNEP